MDGTRYLTDDQPLLVSPTLATAIGLNEALVLQQLHYWLSRGRAGVEHNGVRWVYNSYEGWREQFPFWSRRTIQRTFLSLEEQGVLIARQMSERATDRRKYYRIDQARLAHLPDSRAPRQDGTMDSRASRQNGTMNVPDWHDAPRQNGTLEGANLAPSSNRDYEQRLLTETTATAAPNDGDGFEMVLEDEPPELRLVDPGEQIPAEPKQVNEVDTDARERKLGWAVLDSFNRTFGTHFRAKDHVAKIIRRIREHPGLYLEEHEQVIERMAKVPWWEGKPSPNVIYGNAAQFERSMQESGDRKPRNKYERRQAILQFARELQESGDT